MADKSAIQESQELEQPELTEKQSQDAAPNQELQPEQLAADQPAEEMKVGESSKVFENLS